MKKYIESTVVCYNRSYRLWSD